MFMSLIYNHNKYQPFSVYESYLHFSVYHKQKNVDICCVEKKDSHRLHILRIILVIWRWGINLNSSCNATSRAWRFLSASIMCRTFCPKMSYTCSIVGMSDEHTGQSMPTTLFWQKTFCGFWQYVFWHCHPRHDTGTDSSTGKARQQASPP